MSDPADRPAHPGPGPVPGGGPAHDGGPAHGGGPAYGQEAPYAPQGQAPWSVPPEPPASGSTGPGGQAPWAGQPGAYPSRPWYPRNDLAVWSLVLGALGVLGCVFFTGIPAILVGNAARRAVVAGEADNDGMATAGVVLGWVAVGLGILLVLVLVLAVLVPLVLTGVAVSLTESTGGW